MKPNTTVSEEQFRDLILALLDLAEQLVEPAVPDARREQLRDHVGQRNIFNLKNALVLLCSSTAYKTNGPYRRATSRSD